MTILRIALAGSKLAQEKKDELARRLIDAFAEVEVGHSSPEIQDGFVVLFERVAERDLWRGARPMVEAGKEGKAAVISAHVMAGPWDRSMKREIISRVEEIVRDVAGMPRTGTGADIWM